MDKTQFSVIANRTLCELVDIIETKDIEGSIDVDFLGDIINLTTIKGIFVINKHSAAQEIWLASPVSGPYHFSYINNQWENKTGQKLHEVLKEELNIDFSS